jgi:hypothetical protein
MRNDQHDRETRTAFQQPEGKRPLTEFEKEQRALHKNFERSKAERLARETATKGGSS